MNHLSPFYKTVTLCSLLILAACSSMPGALPGNDLSHLSLRDKRLSESKVQVLESMPSQSSSLGKVVSQRCQATLFSEAPLDKTLMTDIKAEAYRLGANAISDIKIEQRGAVSEGCWNVYTATANMLVVE